MDLQGVAAKARIRVCQASGLLVACPWPRWRARLPSAIGSKVQNEIHHCAGKTACGQRPALACRVTSMTTMAGSGDRHDL